MSLLAQTTDLDILSDTTTSRILQLQTPFMSGPDVIQLQKQLQKAGYSLPQYGVDGIYGSETKMAVTAFQEDNGLSITGSVGPKTAKALQQAAEVSWQRFFPAHLDTAISYFGAKERLKENHGPDIKRFLASVGLDEGYPYCAAFVSYCLEAADGRRERAGGRRETQLRQGFDGQA